MGLTLFSGPALSLRCRLDVRFHGNGLRLFCRQYLYVHTGTVRMTDGVARRSRLFLQGVLADLKLEQGKDIQNLGATGVMGQSL